MANFLALITAIGAALAAYAAWKSAKETKKIVLAQIINDIRDQFNSSDLGDCIKKLNNYRCHHGQDIEDQFFAGLALAERPDNGIGPTEEIDVDRCRRIYSHIFHKLKILLDSGCIDIIFIKKIIYRDEVDLLLNIIEPLERTKAQFIKKEFNSATFDAFREIFRDKQK